MSDRKISYGSGYYSTTILLRNNGCLFWNEFAKLLFDCFRQWQDIISCAVVLHCTCLQVEKFWNVGRRVWHMLSAIVPTGKVGISVDRLMDELSIRVFRSENGPFLNLFYLTFGGLLRMPYGVSYEGWYTILRYVHGPSCCWCVGFWLVHACGTRVFFEVYLILAMIGPGRPCLVTVVLKFYVNKLFLPMVH